MRLINHFYFRLLIIVLLISAVSCKKDDNNKPVCDSEPKREIVTFKNVSPDSSAVFGMNETVFIHAEMEAPDTTLHGYDVYVFNNTTGDTVFQVNRHEHGNTLLIEEEWINNVTVHSDMQVDFNIRLSHEGNHITKTVYFHCHPL